MKITSILHSTLATTLAIVLLSANAFAQSGSPLKHKTHPQITPSAADRSVLPHTAGLIQIYDSVYVWQWDSNANAWAVDAVNRTINVVYDAAYNLLGYESQLNQSGVWNNNFKIINTYNAANDNTSTTEQSWNGTAWENYTNDTYTYNTGHKETGHIAQTWNGTFWVNEINEQSTYDSNNNRLSFLIQYWNGTAWENSDQTLNTYDANNNMLTALDQAWNSFSWDNMDLKTYTYDVNNNLINQVNQYWNGSSWVNNIQYISTYIGNNMSTYTLQTWNGTAWVDGNRSAFTYDINNNLLTTLTEMWNGSSWQNASLTTNTYDAQNNLTSRTLEIWNLGTWEYSSRNLFTYNASNLILDNLLETYDPVFNYWVMSFRISTGYDANDLINKTAFQTYTVAAGLAGDSIQYYYHTVMSLNDPLQNQQSINIYPNPASSSITIHTNDFAFNTLTILNTEGREVYTKQIQSNTRQQKLTVDVKSFPAGNYLLKISAGNETRQAKFLISR